MASSASEKRVRDVDDLDVTPGTLFEARYRIDDVLGRGGSSVVAAAVDTRSNERVAVKLLREPDRKSAERLVREARTLAGLASPHIARLLESGVTSAGAPYLVTELIDGRDLSEYLAEHGPLPMPLAVEIARQACVGLAAAHARGVVHRDIKPGNVLLTRTTEGRPLVKLVDFGVARALDATDESTLTESGHLLGTPRYMPPEQIKNAHAADARADIYSMGAVLYRLLTNEYPFEGETAGEIIINIASTPAPSVRERREEAPSSLDAVVRKCLAKTPAGRVQTAQELETLLGDVLGEIGESPASVTMPELAPRPRVVAVPVLPPASLGSPTRRTAWIAVGLVALGGAGFLALRTSREPTAPVAASAPSVSAAPSSASSIASAPPPVSAVGSELTVAESVVDATAPAPSGKGTPPPQPPNASVKRPASPVAPSVAPPAASSVSCNPPYNIDDEGRKVYKRECLR